MKTSPRKRMNDKKYKKGGQPKMLKPKSFYQDIPIYKGFKWAGFWDGYHHFTAKEEKGYTEVRATDSDIEDGSLITMIDIGVTRAIGGQMKGGGQADVWYQAEYYDNQGGHGHLEGSSADFDAEYKKALDLYKREKKAGELGKSTGYIGVSGSGDKFAIIYVDKTYVTRMNKSAFGNYDNYDEWVKVANEVLETGKPQTGKYSSMKSGGTVSPRKARRILHEGVIGGKPISEKQRKFFGSRASGYPVKKNKGGEAENKGIDLFEDYENIPTQVQNILDKHEEGISDGDYNELAKAKEELEAIGYTFEYYLDGQAYDLRKIGEIGKVEYAEKHYIGIMGDERLEPFAKIIKKSDNFEDAFNEIKKMGAISGDVTDAFDAKYNPDGKLTLKEAFRKFYDEIKSDSMKGGGKISTLVLKTFKQVGLFPFKTTTNGLIVAEDLKTHLYGLYTKEGEEVAPAKYQYIDEEVNANGMVRVTDNKGDSGAIEAFVIRDDEEMKTGGGVGDLEKELHKLQRDLNSSRLQTYIEGDSSEEEKARKREREVKLARFNEVLRLLREKDRKYSGGSMATGSDLPNISEKNEYKVYIVNGDRESGAYTTYGKNYIDASNYFSSHWNDVQQSNEYGTNWKEIGQKKEGMPKKHQYLKDEKGNTILLVDFESGSSMAKGGRLIFSVYPHQKLISVTQGKKEIEIHKYTTDKERDEIVEKLKGKGVRQRVPFQYNKAGEVEGASPNVSTLISYAQNNDKLKQESDAIYDMAKTMNWDTDRLQQQFKRIFSYMAETSYNKENTENPIEMTEDERNEFATQLASQSVNGSEATTETEQPQGEPNISEAKKHLAEATAELEAADQEASVIDNSIDSANRHVEFAKDELEGKPLPFKDAGKIKSNLCIGDVYHLPNEKYYYTVISHREADNSYYSFQSDKEGHPDYEAHRINIIHSNSWLGKEPIKVAHVDLEQITRTIGGECYQYYLSGKKEIDIEMANLDARWKAFAKNATEKQRAKYDEQEDNNNHYANAKMVTDWFNEHLKDGGSINPNLDISKAGVEKSRDIRDQWVFKVPFKGKTSGVMSGMYKTKEKAEKELLNYLAGKEYDHGYIESYEREEGYELNKNGGSTKTTSNMTAKDKTLSDKIAKLEKALANGKLSDKAKSSMEEKIKKYKYDLNRRIPVGERVAGNKGKFFIEIPAEYRVKMNTLLWNSNLKPRYMELDGKVRITVDNKAKLNRLYKIYSDMLKKKSIPAPSLQEISGKPNKVKRQK